MSWFFSILVFVTDVQKRKEYSDNTDNDREQITTMVDQLCKDMKQQKPFEIMW